MKNRLHIFDLDGVLVDSSSLHTSALRQAVFELVGETASTVDFLEASDGVKTKDKLIRLSKQYKFDKKAVDNRKKELTLEKIELLKPTHLRQALLELRASGKRLALASNSREIFVLAILDKLGIADIFDVIFTGDDIKKGKPHPEIFEAVIGHCGVKPELAVVYEDSVAGLMAASSAGVGTIVKIDPTILLTKDQLVMS